MALQRSDMIGFSRGLHTDSLGVEGALLEAQDVIITREGELKKRGGKALISTFTGVHGLAAGNLYSAASFPGVGTIASFADSAAGYRLAIRPEGGVFSQSSTNRAGTDNFGTASGAFRMTQFKNAFAHDGEIISTGSFGFAPFRWAGSSKANYSTGTVSTTSGSATITGAGTSWSANLEAGMYLWVNSGTLAQRTFRIVSVTSDTALVVDQAPDATVAGASYCGIAIGALSSPYDVFGPSTSQHAPNGVAACSHQGRVFFGNIAAQSTSYKERIRWSALPTESSGKFIGADYWSANAYTDIGVGAGGDIMALASVGSELLVLKQNAVFALRGSVATDGSDLGARVDLISANHGLLYERGFVETKIGLVFADPRGVFVYSGGQIRSLTQGRVQRWWENAMTSETITSAVGDRIIFCDQGNGRIMAYDIATDTWTTQSTQYYGRVVQTYTTAGAVEYEMGFRTQSDGADNWAGDFATGSGSQSQDAGLSTAPDMQVVTHPIPLTSPVGNARPVRVDVNGFATDDAELSVSIIPGRQGGTEHSVGTLPAGTSDKSHRLRVPPGASLNPYYQVKLAASGTMSDARIYGVSILSAPSGRVDP
jgi:hypothetical protein